jgi:glycosyltransferase involved in cell wall biosynthesis
MGSNSTSSLHVQLVTWDDDPPVGGQGVYIRELRRALVSRGTRVSTCAGRGEFAISYPRITGRAHLDMSMALNRSLRPILESEADVLHVSGGPGGIVLLRRTPSPTVYTAHHTHRQSPWARQARRVFERLERRSYDLANAVAAVSPSTAQAVIDMGVPSSKVVVIPPGIDVGLAALGEIEREEARILFVGRLEPEKGPLDAIAAMDALTQKVAGCRGFVVGSGSLRATVAQAAASTLGRVTFLGTLSDEEVRHEYCRAQLVLVPSAFEGLGMVALEAMASGAAVVGYDVEGLHDTIGSGGRLVPRGDVRGLVDACIELLSDPEGLRDLAQLAHDTVSREHSWTRCAEQFNELYRQVSV